MSKIIDDLYDKRDKAWSRVIILKRRIAKDIEELAEQTRIADEAEKSAELLCASDLFPMCYSTIPKESGLVKKEQS